MPAIEPEYLLAAGIFLIGIEIVLYSFFIIWIGIGLIVAGFLSYAVSFDSGYTQLAIAFTIGFALLIMLRKRAVSFIIKSEDRREEHIHRGGIGIVDNGMIKMDGTYWQTDDDLSRYENGDRVKVVDIHKNRAVLEDEKD